LDKVKRKFKDKPGVYTVYTKDEADKEGIEYVHWRKAKPGDWALTDDNFVMELMRAKTYTDEYGVSKQYMTFSAGCTWDGPSVDFEYLPRKKYKAWDVSKPQTWDEKEAKKGRTKRTAQVYAHQLLAGKVDLGMLGKLHNPGSKKPAYHMKQLLKTEGVRKLVSKEIDVLLNDMGVTKQFAVQVLMEAVEAARDSGRPSDLLKVAQELQTITGIKGGEQRIIRTESLEASSKVLDLISKESEKIDRVKMQRKIDAPAKEELHEN
jgi:hypothetical protein